MIIISNLKSNKNQISTSGGHDWELQINEYILHFAGDNIDICLTEEQAERVCQKLKEHLEARSKY